MSFLEHPDFQKLSYFEKEDFILNSSNVPKLYINNQIKNLVHTFIITLEFFYILEQLVKQGIVILSVENDDLLYELTDEANDIIENNTGDIINFVNSKPIVEVSNLLTKEYKNLYQQLGIIHSKLWKLYLLKT